MGEGREVGMKSETEKVTPTNRNINKKDDEAILLQFLDSLDAYISLCASLSSTLRQGWLELAAARLSMPTSTLSPALFDLKHHQPATTLQITHSNSEHPRFTLRKWVSLQDNNNKAITQQIDSTLRHRGGGHDETTTATTDSPDDQVKKERSKALSVFGALVSPRLRYAQSSFESVLEILVDIANARSSMLSAFELLQQKKEDQSR